MSGVHIYRAKDQPATNFAENFLGRIMRFRNEPRSLLFAQCCGKKRQARNLIVHVYFDCTKFFCKPLKGCNAKTAKPWWCTRHQRMHSPKTRYWSCREGKKKEKVK